MIQNSEIVKLAKAPSKGRQKKIAKIKAKIIAGKYRVNNLELAKALLFAH